MTVQGARAILSLIWVLSSGLLVLLLVARSVTGFYRGDLMELWSWVSQLLFPVLGIILAAWSANASEADAKPVTSPFVFWGALLVSIIYIASLYLVIALEPISAGDWISALHSSGIYLGLLQGFVIIALGKFFIENLH